MKVNNCDFVDEGATNYELNISQRIAQANSSHKELLYVRTIVNNFRISDLYNNHICLIYEAIRESLYLFERRCKNDQLTLGLLKEYLRLLLISLNYFHSKCYIVHTSRLEAIIICRLKFTRRSQTLSSTI